MHLSMSSNFLGAGLAFLWFIPTRHVALALSVTHKSSDINLSTRDSVAKTTNWSLQIYNQSAEIYTLLPKNASADFWGRDYLSFTYYFDGRTSSATNDDVYTSLFYQLSDYLAWVTPESILQLVANPATAPCPVGGCSSYDECKDVFKIISEEMKTFFPRHGPVDLAGSLNQTINAKYLPNTTPAATLNCVLLLHDTKQLPLDQCDSEDYDLTIDNWNKLKVDDKLQVFIQGGNDLSDVDGTDIEVGGLIWPGIGEATLSAQLREQLTSANTVLNCSLKNPCQAPPDCDMVGQYFTRDKPKWRSHWGYSALWALRNINQELTTQYIAIQAATIDATLATFNVDTYFPKPNKNFPLLNVLTGLGTAFAVVSGFLGPLSAVAGASAGAVGAIAPAVGTYFERYYAANVDRSDPNVAQKTFAPKVRQVYDLFINALDNITSDLFAGREIEGQVLLTEMMKGGRWVNPQVLTEVSDAKEQIFYEIFARSLDALWKTPTSDKRWVLFVDLQEDGDTTYKCGNNTDGPPDLRYCADGGVYYAYNFVEKGDHLGFLSYPWGADQLKSALKIDPAWIPEGSAKTYKLAKQNPDLDPFDFNNTLGSERLLATLDTAVGVNLGGQGGRFAGSWTLPVCNASTWGAAWNFPYNSTDNDNYHPTDDDSDHHPPCLCGEGGLETARWVEAAGLKGFDTFHERCRRQLTESKFNFAWPEGVTCVNYGFKEAIKKLGTDVDC